MSLRLIATAPSSAAVYRADLIRRYVAARSRQERAAVMAEAATYDLANPGQSLRDELIDARRGDQLPAA
ncbi:MAG: hypothetical protein LBV60_19695, partial [Streptomyces sp.]|nr:hypothetical protein [Streptomyces sp.]